MLDRTNISSGSPYEPVSGFSRAVRVGHRVLVAGTAPVWPDGSCDPDPGVQTRRCLEIIVAALREAGAGPQPGPAPDGAALAGQVLMQNSQVGDVAG